MSESDAKPADDSGDTQAKGALPDPESKGDGSEEFPTAVLNNRVSFGDLFRGSRFWLLTLVCMMLAIGLVWWSFPSNGIEILIHFPDGHGLEAEDAVRFRGIEVGRVKKVSLNPKLDAVDVTIQLKPFAKPLAREGTRFWIVKPELSISGISGLETAVGHKYVGLIPGEEGGAFQREFRGLEESPPESFAESGIELVFRGEKRHSISAGSPVTFRGVEIGRILTVGLSTDSRFVDIRARIYHEHRQLVTTKSVVWANSGVNLDYKFGQGLMLNTESLETIARGGVSLLTISNGGTAVSSGHVFTLYARPEVEWFEAANNVRATSIQLRGAIPLQLRWTSTARILGGEKDKTISGIPIVERDGTTSIIVPGDIYAAPKRLEEGSLKIGPLSSEELFVEIVPDEELASQPMVKIKVPKSFCNNWLAPKDFRQPESAESCVAVRGWMPDSASSALIPYSIDPAVIGEDWQLINFSENEDLWHGTPVLSNEDGKVIGMLSVAGSGRAGILLIDPQLIKN